MREKKYKLRNFGMFYVVAILSLIFGLAVSSSFAQTGTLAQSNSDSAAKAEAVFAPIIAEFRGITIGMTADEVKDKLGKAKSQDDTGFYYVYSDGESLQIALDNDRKVRMISAFYVGDDANAPVYADIFGTDVKVEVQPSGKIYKVVRYPDAGYWIAYSKIAVEDGPMTTLTMQKMP